MRRAAVSCAANIVEGAGRRSKKDFNRFLDISFASVRELGYYIHLAEELDYLKPNETRELLDAQGSTAAAIAALLKQRRSS